MFWPPHLCKKCGLHKQKPRDAELYTHTMLIYSHSSTLNKKQTDDTLYEHFYKTDFSQ